MTTAPLAWGAGCLGCVGTLAVLVVTLFAVVFVAATARDLSTGDGAAFAYSLAYPAARYGAFPAILLAIIIGGVVANS